MRKIRDYIRLFMAFLFCWLYLPHFLIYAFMNKKKINADIDRYASTYSIRLNHFFWLVFLIHQNWAFRTLFYYRIGPVWSMLIGWWRPKDRYFDISFTSDIEGGAYFAHPRSTGINANHIGKNFSARQLTTLGNKRDGDNANRPWIGDNVTLGTNVTIIGAIHIGNNVTIGAGSVVVKDVPDNAVVVGNPARIIKYNTPIISEITEHRGGVNKPIDFPLIWEVA